MWNRDPGADTRRPQTLALEQDFENIALADPALKLGHLGGTLRQLLQRLFLGGDAQIGDHTFGMEQIGDIHDARYFRLPAFDTTAASSLAWLFPCGSTQPTLPSGRR